ncbi:uncharacterized protein LOC118439480 [Folsomia candida]|uniref:uncharacterized protein LOC118439480 n=1 Tax=Folsomia candida TaxID=158441 RepID=UPI0016052BD0|nr:uncharacterized protein LOC118439480 [Folsomia candida]
MQPGWMKETSMINYMFLGFVTIFTAILLPVLTSLIPSQFVMYYITGMTLSGIVFITLFPVQLRTELTYLTGLFAAMVGVGIMGVVMYSVVPTENLDGPDYLWLIIVGGALTIFFTMFWICLVKKMMMMMSGGRLSKSPEEFILASMYLYVGSAFMFIILPACIWLRRIQVCFSLFETPAESRNSGTARNSNSGTV